MTGDVTINPTADCLIMTTEVKGGRGIGMGHGTDDRGRADQPNHLLPHHDHRSGGRGVLGRRGGHRDNRVGDGGQAPGIVTGCYGGGRTGAAAQCGGALWRGRALCIGLFGVMGCWGNGALDSGVGC